MVLNKNKTIKNFCMVIPEYLYTAGSNIIHYVDSSVFIRNVKT